MYTFSRWMNHKTRSLIPSPKSPILPSLPSSGLSSTLRSPPRPEIGNTASSPSRSQARSYGSKNDQHDDEYTNPNTNPLDLIFEKEDPDHSPNFLNLSPASQFRPNRINNRHHLRRRSEGKSKLLRTGTGEHEKNGMAVDAVRRHPTSRKSSRPETLQHKNTPEHELKDTICKKKSSRPETLQHKNTREHELKDTICKKKSSRPETLQHKSTHKHELKDTKYHKKPESVQLKSLKLISNHFTNKYKERLNQTSSKFSSTNPDWCVDESTKTRSYLDSSNRSHSHSMAKIPFRKSQSCDRTQWSLRGAYYNSVSCVENIQEKKEETKENENGHVPLLPKKQAEFRVTDEMGPNKFQTPNMAVKERESKNNAKPHN